MIKITMYKKPDSEENSLMTAARWWQEGKRIQQGVVETYEEKSKQRNHWREGELYKNRRKANEGDYDIQNAFLHIWNCQREN